MKAHSFNCEDIFSCENNPCFIYEPDKIAICSNNEPIYYTLSNMKSYCCNEHE